LSNAFSLLIKPVKKIVKERGFTDPTQPQEEALPLILEGKNVLLIAPTGTGKTEAAFLPVFSKLIELVEKPRGIKILYITPLRSLNRDLLDRLRWWCIKLDIKIAVRHGDTDTKERFSQSKMPPDILITTPETLQAILPGRNMRRHLQAVKWVIVDEVHEFAEDKRGSHLALCLERLRLITDSNFQLIGLSATIGSPDKVAQFLVGTDRPVEIVKVPVARYMQFEIIYPRPSPDDVALAEKLYTHPEVAARLSLMRKLIEEHQSVLLFTNTRSIAEILASRFRVWDVDFPISIHHGSLAKPARIIAEKELKGGQLKGLVCTSSLELGIDIGYIDLCIQYMSPRQVTRLVQRVGRSGHRIGRIAKGVIITMDSDDALEAMVVARRAYLEDLEPINIPKKPLDALAHQIVGLFTLARRWDYDQILEIFQGAYPYGDLTEADLEKIITYMHERYPRLAWSSFEEKVVLKPKDVKEMYQYYYGNLSMIPDQKNYLIIDETTEIPVGILDEAFVAEYGVPGTKFIVRGRAWNIVTVYGDRIYVMPVDDPTGAIPSWIGEEIPVPFDVTREVGEIRSSIEQSMLNGCSLDGIAAFLAQQYPADTESIMRSIKETIEHIEQGFDVPTDKRITIEEWTEYIIINACFGSLVNRTLAIIMGHLLSEETGYTVAVQDNPYRIILQTFGNIDAAKIKKVLYELSTSDIRDNIIESVVKTGLFKRRLIHVARRFGAVSKEADFSNISLNLLSKSFLDTAIYDEALNEAITKDLDVFHTTTVLNNLKKKVIEVRIVKSDEATPITKIGLDKMGRRYNLIAPEKMRMISIESAKARLLNEVKTLVCTRCQKYIQMLPIKELPTNVICPECSSGKIGVLSYPEHDVRKIFDKGKHVRSAREKDVEEYALKTAKLVEAHGLLAVIVLSGKNLRLSEVEEILAKEHQVNDKLFAQIITAEKKALTRSFW